MKLLKLYEAFQNSITLSELYKDEYPHKDELLWEYVNESDMDVRFGIISINPAEYFRYIKDQYEEAEEIDTDTIQYYKDNPDKALSKPVVVFSPDTILIDGYHRIVALYELGITEIEAVDIYDEL